MPQTLIAQPEKLKTGQYEQLENKRVTSTVLLLQEMQQTNDLQRRQSLFEQAADQESSHISEVLNGRVSTKFDFETSGGQLYFLQPSGVTKWYEMHNNGYQRASALAIEDGRFEFYAQLSKAELDNAQKQEELIQVGDPFAMVELSLAGDDLASAEMLKKIGRDPELRRAFLRVSVYDGARFSIYSESIDGMDRIDGLDIARGWGKWEEAKIGLAHSSSSVDILNNPIILSGQELPIDEMHTLAAELVEAYDERLRLRTGKIHRSGRSPEDSVHTYEFVLNNPDLMNAHMEGLCDMAKSNLDAQDLAKYSEDLRYDIMSSFKKRLEGTWVDSGSLGQSVADAGASERAAGTTYFGCDGAVGAGTNIANGGYANNGEKSLMDLSGKKIQCGNSNCKKKVVVPDSDLIAGKLSCTECGLQLDVCTGEMKFKKDSENKAAKITSQESPLAKWNREYDEKKRLDKLQLEHETQLADAA